MAFRTDYRRCAAALVLVGCFAVCQGCASQVADARPAGARGPVDTGTYPNLNVLPRLATDQFNNDTLQSHNESVTAAVVSQRTRGAEAFVIAAPAAGDAGRLRLLGATRGQQVLRAIETPATDAPASRQVVPPKQTQ